MISAVTYAKRKLLAELSDAQEEANKAGRAYESSDEYEAQYDPWDETPTPYLTAWVCAMDRERSLRQRLKELTHWLNAQHEIGDETPAPGWWDAYFRQCQREINEEVKRSLDPVLR